MTQWQYDSIRLCILNGMPVVARELIAALDEAIAALNEKAKETKESKTK